MKRFLTGLVILALCTIATSASAKKNIVLAGQNVPFCVNKGLKLNGISVDTYKVIMEMTGTPFNEKQIKFIEWDTAYKVAKKKSNYVLLGVPRTPDIEDKFKWVGPIDFPCEVLIAKAKSDCTVNNLSQASQYKIATVRGSGSDTFLLQNGVSPKSLKTNSSYVQALLQLKKGEADLAAFTDMEAAYLMRRMSLNIKKFKVVYKGKGIPLYFAFGKSTSDDYIKLLNNALATYKKPSSQWTSAYDKNVRKYLPKGVVK